MPHPRPRRATHRYRDSASPIHQSGLPDDLVMLGSLAPAPLCRSRIFTRRLPGAPAESVSYGNRMHQIRRLAQRFVNQAKNTCRRITSEIHYREYGCGLQGVRRAPRTTNLGRIPVHCRAGFPVHRLHLTATMQAVGSLSLFLWNSRTLPVLQRGLCEFEHLMHLLGGNLGKPLEELVDGRARSSAQRETAPGGGCPQSTTHHQPWPDSGPLPRRIPSSSPSSYRHDAGSRIARAF